MYTNIQVQYYFFFIHEKNDFQWDNCDYNQNFTITIKECLFIDTVPVQCVRFVTSKLSIFVSVCGAP